jgi:hypothetical protein
MDDFPGRTVLFPILNPNIVPQSAYHYLIMQNYKLVFHICFLNNNLEQDYLQLELSHITRRLSRQAVCLLL